MDGTLLAQMIVDRAGIVGSPEHIIGVVGWPYTGQVNEVRTLLEGAHLPLILQNDSSADTTTVGVASSYVFHVNPSESAQGDALGQYAGGILHAKTAIVLRDTNDATSVALADAFIARAAKQGINVINDPAQTFSESTTTVDGYQQVIQDVMQNNVDLLMIAGTSVDGIRLAHAVGTMARNNPTDTQLATLNILGGDALDTGLVLGIGTGPDAVLAASFPQDMSRLIFSAGAHYNEWSLQGASKPPAFLSDWNTVYGDSTIGANNAPLPLNESLLVYDGVQVLGHAVALVKGMPDGQTVRIGLVSLGQGSNGAYQGMTGSIQFDPLGAANNKAVVILNVAVDTNGSAVIKLNRIY
jgi:ABC-type branched-subunit amino acid transport system substrate-binding protein